MGDLPTAKNYSGVHTVYAVCRDPACDHWQELDLAAWSRPGTGTMALDASSVAGRPPRRPRAAAA
jgi:hypothetical protein